MVLVAAAGTVLGHMTRVRAVVASGGVYGWPMAPMRVANGTTLLLRRQS